MRGATRSDTATVAAEIASAQAAVTRHAGLSTAAGTLDNGLLSPHGAGSSEQALAATAGEVARAILMAARAGRRRTGSTWYSSRVRTAER